MPLTILKHNLVDHWMTRLRDRDTPPREFRRICRRLSAILTMEAARDLAVEPETIETPLETFEGSRVAHDIVVVPILRAGLGMLDEVVDVFPRATVGFVGLERNHETAEAQSYYGKLPPLAGKTVFLLDPMLATGGSASAALQLVVEQGATDVRFLVIVAAPEGVAQIEGNFPEVKIFAAALDRKLNDRKYILPGLGDFGDRLYGTEPRA